MTIYQQEPRLLIEKVAQELKKNTLIAQPEWASFAKTGTHKTQPPTNPDWWHIRVAAILRTVALSGPIGTNTLKIKYGGKKRRGHKKPEFRTGSGKIARTALQQLESAGLVKQAVVSGHKGRVITSQGASLIAKCSTE